VADLPFHELWCIDFEFGAVDGERPAVRCLVATEWRTRRTIRTWLEGQVIPSNAPFDTGPDSLVVAFFASAEMGSFRALGWPMPTNVLDLYVEFKWLTCGRDGEPKPSLLYALDRFGLPSMAVTEKRDMRDLALRGGPYTTDEREALLDYCQADVNAVAALLTTMLPRLDLPRAVLRGRFTVAVGVMEHNGIPVDQAMLARIDEHREGLQTEMVRVVDGKYGVYDGTSFRVERFGAYLDRKGIAWPRLDDGRLSLDKDVFRDMVRVHPELNDLHQLRQMLSVMRFADLPVGRDGRNRTLFSPFGSMTGRCTPSNSRFVFGRPAWMRSLIRPEPGKALAYIDWSSQEYGIGAVLSGDQAMIADYERGDPYLGFAKRIRFVPADATKTTHKTERSVFKTVILGTQYCMGESTLAARINRPVAFARELLQLHRRTYPRYWQWSDAAVNIGLFGGRLWTRFGWQVWVGANANPRSLANFPCQANGAEMLRLAAMNMVNGGVMLDATVHDAALIEAAADDIDVDVEKAREAMARASADVLGGFRLRTDATVIRAPNRYRDDRGATFFDEIVRRLEAR
jgi:hypothetical protein